MEEDKSFEVKIWSVNIIIIIIIIIYISLLCKKLCIITAMTVCGNMASWSAKLNDRNEILIVA